MGTGDCFVLFFKNQEDQVLFKMMIDCGAYSISKAKMDKYAKQILKDVDNKLDVLLITHEHQDHVLGFQRSEKLFKEKLKVKELWLPWTEDETDPLVDKFKKEYGQKKKSLAIAALLLRGQSKTDLFRNIYLGGANDEGILNARLGITDALEELTELNTDLLPDDADLEKSVAAYKGGLKGYEIVKNELEREREKVRFLQTGSIVENVEGLENIRIYILGPPKMWTDVKKEHGKEGETYKHNKELELVRAFSSFPFEEEVDNQCPFQSHYIIDPSLDLAAQVGDKDSLKGIINIKKIYEENTYRRIDFDWLISAAKLSLRLTRGINNLSAVLAIEFVDSGKVMLFPGDAEFGSWRTWHKLDWNCKGNDGTTHLTTDLLNRTVFYKVAHHLSHNGTPKELGMDLLNNKDLVAMATLDYNVINSKWKNTMPNRALVRDLVTSTKGRFILLNSTDLYYDKAKTIKLQDVLNDQLDNLNQEKLIEYSNNLQQEDLFIQYTVNGN
jgi:exonuclease VII small subunit